MCVLKSTFAFKIGIALCALFMVVVPATTADATGGRPEDPSHALRAVEEAAAELVAKEDGPPGVIVVIQRRNDRRVIRAGVANLQTGARLRVHAHMRLASVAKAFSGATALALVARGVLSLEDTVGKLRPDLPHEWANITLRQLLNHTSGIRDFSKENAFLDALLASLLVAPPPVQLLSYIENPEPIFTPGTEFKYSNSDNIIVGLMIEAATGRSYERALRRLVTMPFGLFETTLPSDAELPRPFVHGYQRDDDTGVPEDVSELVAAGWAWASGGVVSTPEDANEFVRRYVSGQEANSKTHAEQFQFIPGGSSEPPGPGTNSAGLAIFRYETRCGTVYGHTGNTLGYTQFVSATADGKRSATVSINAQFTPEPEHNPVRFAELRELYELAVCAALD
jgi:D-alanyl-D-alanine carboxypeptidase